ncbi:MAG TPA: hypothetical protein ENJ31_07010, partial [Anaerolineae bacterium]|nr:hypothetical protein [Anaerolineae bacterium]
ERVYAQAVGQAAAHDVVIFGEWALIKLYVKQGDTWQEDLIARLQQAAPKLVVIAWHNPAAILRCPTVPTFLTAYGNTPAQVTAVVAVLVGEQETKGQLPIHLAP